MISVTIELDPSGPSLHSPSASSICSNTLLKEGVTDGTITLVFGSDTLLSSLKKEFFHLDQLTDVIAFRLNEYSDKEVEGEIYISLPRALENAAELKEDHSKEVARLIIHGSLHLLDYSDETDKEKLAMRQRENMYLDQFPWVDLAVNE